MWRVCVWSKWFLILPPHLMESQACYQVFPCKGGWWETNGDNIFFSPCGKKKKSRKSVLCYHLWPTVSPTDQHPGVAVISWLKSSVKSQLLQLQITVTLLGLKCCTLDQRFVHFWRFPTVNRPGASPRVFTQMYLTTGRRQTGTANFMGQLWEVNEDVERSKQKICLASSHGTVMFHEIHILC